ncbi:hypothetical protein, variant [Phytophthora nicotianae INRA-310]|uniref:BED-type domain-containing protein n=1 Tax=Phytophthora nicotianae (strain INRA-310) TaxID=761204 RepID=W2PVG6_PHYN3|nr:hypothetical protein, variant [Phytophthora nicotianae INRA-310]ETN04902.1 hypothetical protein, variant [Phytophthora nicotianae INRA-310]
MAITARPRFTSAQVTGFYFQPCRDDFDEIILEYFRCRCGTVRKQTRRNGRANLMQHVRHEHPNFEAEMLEATTSETGTLLSYVSRSSQNLYGWLMWVVTSNLPLTFCENRATRRYTTLDPVCVETLRAALEGVSVAVERSIASEMPDQFGLILDGWTHMSEHYLGVFACYEVGGKVKTPLICMAPLMNEADDDLSALAHREFLADMLPRDFGKQIDQCLFVVGDNCSVNQRLASLIGVPLIGCASHRLNRVVQQDLQSHEADLAAVHGLMIKLRTLTQSAKLRLKTSLRPVIRQDTRWSSTFAMLHRYFKLLEHLDKDDDDVAELLPGPVCNRRLRKLLKELANVESVSKALQGSADLLDVREWFDGLIAMKPQYAHYLAPRADIVHSPDFESGCVRVLRGNSNRLTRTRRQYSSLSLQVLQPRPNRTTKRAHRSSSAFKSAGSWRNKSRSTC